MRHIVNFGLLFSFGTLATTGVLAFVFPFSLVTTRIHVVFGLATAVLVLLHLVSRVKYFKVQLSSGSKQAVSKVLLSCIVVVWGALLASAYFDLPPADLLIQQGYEYRHRAQIVRTSGLAASIELARNNRLVARGAAEKADVAVSLLVNIDRRIEDPPAIAVWAETKTGAMIETLYLDQTLAFAEESDWGGRRTTRSAVLPIWRHRYTMLSGVDPDGEVDALSGATASHSFSLDDYLVLGEEKEFVICVEVNSPADPNEDYADEHLGQPSLWYTARVELDSPQPYALLELTGHGGGAEKGGTVRYDLDTITSAKKIVDLLLVRTERQ